MTRNCWSATCHDEVEPAERRAFESHLLACVECRTELKGLRAVRTRLGLWAPKEPELEFQVVRRPAAAVARSWIRSPVWALAAAAVLVLAVASAIANVEVKYGSDGLTVRTGWARVPAQAAGVPAVTTVAGGDQALRVQLQTIAERSVCAIPSPRPRRGRGCDDARGVGADAADGF